MYNNTARRQPQCHVEEESRMEGETGMNVDGSEWLERFFSIIILFNSV